MITPKELAALALDAAQVAQNNAGLPIVQRCNELAAGLTTDDYLTMLPRFQNNVVALSLWLSGFTAAVVMLERDERLG